MSRANIVSIVNLAAGLEAAGEIADAFGQEEIGIPLEGAAIAANELEGIVVTFQLRAGGTCSYRYDGEAAAAILAGADPAGFSGVDFP
jgi:hypothetical protein